MQCFVNGEPISTQASTLADLLHELGYTGKKVVVAVNETFVPNTGWSTCTVQADDRLDVLSAIAGG